MYAAISGDLETVKYLVNKGADLNLLTKGKESLAMKAASSGNLDILE